MPKENDMKSNTKSIFEIFLTPVLITIIGIAGTFFINDAQDKRSALITSVQIEKARILKLDEQKHQKLLSIKNERIELVKYFGSQLVGSKKNERLNALIIISKFDEDLSRQLSKSLIDSKNRPKNIAQTTKLFREMEKKSGQLMLSIDNLDVKNDGSRGKTKWFFKILINGESVQTTQSYSLNDGKENKFDPETVPETVLVDVINDDRLTVEVQAIKAQGSSRGLLAVGDHKTIMVDLIKKQTGILEFPVSVAGFPDKGEFVVKLSYKYKKQ